MQFTAGISYNVAMPIISLHSLHKSFGAQKVFSDVNLQVQPGERIGLVGPNGAGKSTLLEIIAGKIEPESGSISISKGTRTGYLTQQHELDSSLTLRENLLSVFSELIQLHKELEVLAEKIAANHHHDSAYDNLLKEYADLQYKIEHAGGYAFEHRIEQVLEGLEFTLEQRDDLVSTLSGGQRTRAALGKILLQDVDVLLLDEPTNHLDIRALDWLESYLLKWKGTLIIVAHDRYFLDRLTTRTLEIAFGKVEDYPGNYSKYIKLRAERSERQLSEYNAQQALIAHTTEFIERYRAGQRSKEARGRQKMLDRMEKIEAPKELPKLKFAIRVEIESGEIALRTDKLTIGFQTDHKITTLLSAPDLIVNRGDRIAVVGPNGSGKTTLLRTIIGEINPLQGKVATGHNVHFGYYSQTHEGLNYSNSIIEEIRQNSHLSEEGARTFLAQFLFPEDDVFKAVGSLSGGERSRVALAKLTLQGANLLILDEPTNHLDLPSRHMLELVLSRYIGTLMIVSHDRFFIDSLVDKIWAIDDFAIQQYEGTYTQYISRQVKQQKSSRANIARVSRKEPEKQPASKRKLEAIESEIAKEEQKLHEIENLLSAASKNADIEQISTLGQEYQQLKSAIDELYSVWAELDGAKV